MKEINIQRNTKGIEKKKEKRKKKE